MDKEKKIDFCLKWIRQITDEHKALKTNREEALRYFSSDPKIVPFIEGRSQATTTDFMDTVEWVKPSLLEVFTGGNEVCSLQPVTKEDVEPCENQNILVNHQLRVKNNWFLVLHDWFDDALKLKLGALKYQWYRDVKTIDKEYEGLNEMEYQAKINEPNVTLLTESKIPITEPQYDEFGIMVAPAEYEYDIAVRYKIEDEYPLIEAIPAEEFGFPIGTRDIANARFVYHKTSVSKSEFIKKYSKEKYDEMKPSFEGDDTETIKRERLKDLGGRDFYYNKDKEEIYLYECYYNDEDTAEARISTLCGYDVLEDIKNPYDRPPFRCITPVKMAHRICGYSYFDLLKENMRIRTALLRQILDNVYFANNRRYFGDPLKVNMDDFLNNNYTGAFIRVKGDPNMAIRPEDKAPLPTEVFTFWEMLNVEKDYHSGVPRSFQGVNPKSLNETFRGQAQQVNQASQRISLMARLIAEMGIAPLVSDIVELNMRFLKKKVAVRYLNDWKEINPDNIIGKYDVTVNVGTGSGNKDQTIMYIQQLLGLYAQLYKGGVGIVTNDNVYNAMKELIKNMGFKNTGDYITEPGFIEAARQLVMFAVQSGVMQNPQIAPLIEKIAQGVGLQPEMLQQISAQTFPGQETPAQATQPTQPMNPTIPSQGGYFG